MSLSTRKNFFDRKSLILAVAFGVLVFSFSYLCFFFLTPSAQISELTDMKYTYSSREVVNASSVSDWTTIEKIEDVRENADSRYLIIKAVLPSVPEGQLYLRSFNGTARISLEGEVLFDNLQENKLSGSSYIRVPLPENFAGKPIEIVLYSPFSNSFHLGVVPSDFSLFTSTTLPYAGMILCTILFVIAIISLVLCFLTGRHTTQMPACFLLAASVLSFSVILLEYSDLFGDLPFLFCLKICLLHIVSMLCLLETAVRYQLWDSTVEGLLAVNILYALCVAFLNGNVFFVSLLKAGIILQVINAVCILVKFSRQRKPVTATYIAATLVFWIADIVFWYALTAQNLTFQLIALALSTGIYGLITGIRIYPRSEKEKPEIISKNRMQVSETVSETENEEKTADHTIEERSYIVDENMLMAKLKPLVFKKVFGQDRHSLNVAEYTFALCGSMGMSEQAARNIADAAALHDIGKLCVSERILAKLEELSEEEFNEIRRHNIYGYQLLNSEADPFFKMAALVAKEHHEHIDGTGYIGLKGDEISIPARIVAVADVFDALVSLREYKKPWEFDKAADYILEHRQDYFDKDVVDAFFSAKTRIYDIYQSHIEMAGGA